MQINLKFDDVMLHILWTNLPIDAFTTVNNIMNVERILIITTELRAKYSRRLQDRSFSEISGYLPPNYFRTWYLNKRSRSCSHSHAYPSITPIRPSSGNCTTGKDTVSNAKHKAAGNENSSKNTFPFYDRVITFVPAKCISDSFTRKLNIIQV